MHQKAPFYVHFPAAQGVNGWLVVSVIEGHLSRSTASNIQAGGIISLEPGVEEHYADLNPADADADLNQPLVAHATMWPANPLGHWDPIHAPFKPHSCTKNEYSSFSIKYI